MRNKRILLGVYSRIVPKIRQVAESIGRVRKEFFYRCFNRQKKGVECPYKAKKNPLTLQGKRVELL